MRKALFATLTALFLVCLINARSVAANDGRGIVKDALTHSLCFQKYWFGWHYEDGAIVPLEIKFEGKKFYVWAKDLPSNGEYDYLVNALTVIMKFYVSPEDRPQKQKETHFAVFFEGRIKDGKAAIVKFEGYNTKAGPFPEFRKFKNRFASGAVMEDTLTVPSDCTPRYDPPTPQKEQMVKTVVSTMKIILDGYSRNGIARYPPEVKIVIADFNTDSPYTFVIVEGAKEVYRVALHDPDDYDSVDYGRDGEYLTGEEYDVAARRLALIRKNGIVRKIAIATR